MKIKLRPGTREDAAACGVIDFEAFKSISSEHNFPWDFPSVEVATFVTTALLSNPGFYSVIAEMDSRIVGSNFLDERNPISGVGPISVDPAVQNQTIGRQLMRAVMDRSTQRGFAGIRLVQAAYHNRSLCLYTKLGFDTRETLSKMFGPPLKLKFPGYEVRPATELELEACGQLCRRIHGHDQCLDLLISLAHRVPEKSDISRISSYSSKMLDNLDRAMFDRAVR
jgi:predicted N-acetyltransferase YhbS